MAIINYQYRVDGGTPVDAGLDFTEDVTGLSEVLYDFEMRSEGPVGVFSAWSPVISATPLPPAALLLDDITSTLHGAYGMSLLKTGYAGDAIRIENAEVAQMDVGFLGDGSLDTASITGTAPYRIVTWYDQSGNGNHKSESFEAGPVLDTADKNARFNGDNVVFGDLSALTAGEIFIRAKVDADPAVGGEGEIWRFGTEVSGDYLPFSDGNAYIGFGSDTRKSAVSTGGVLDSWFTYSVYSATNDWRDYLNGTALRAAITTNTVSFHTASWFGKGFFVGDVETILLFTQKVDGAERDFLHANL